MPETPPMNPPGGPVGQQIMRLFEQGPEAVSFYSDFSQIINTGAELVFQFYETIPGPPGPTGIMMNVRTRLRATIQLSHAHATKLANNILAQIPQPAQSGEKQ